MRRERRPRRATRPRAGFRRVLVPVDFTPRSRASLELATQLAGPEGHVRVLHVIETIEHLPARSLRGFYARLTRAATRKLRELVEGRSRPATPQAELRFGNRAAEIVRCAASCRADLIVMASHAVSAADWATVSYRVALAAPCSVLLVK